MVVIFFISMGFAVLRDLNFNERKQKKKKFLLIKMGKRKEKTQARMEKNIKQQDNISVSNS